MTRAVQQYQQADDCGYQLRALLRTMEERSRDLRDAKLNDDHLSTYSDFVLLLELAGGLCETLHDEFQLQTIAAEVGNEA